MSAQTHYVAALRDGPGLVYMSTAGRWFPLSAFKVRGSALQLRRYRYVGSAIGVAESFAKRAGCGWRVEMVTG